MTLVASVLTGQATVAGFPVGPTFGVTDFILSTGGWTLVSGGVFLAGLDPNGGGNNFVVASTGSVTPTTGGAGAFIATIQSVPEPSSALSLTLGLIGMGVIAGRMRPTRVS